MKRSSAWLLVALSGMLVCGCSRRTAVEPAPRREGDPVDRRADVHLDPLKVVHQVFPVRNHSDFTFSVPAGQRDARLVGNFRSFTKRSNPDSTSDQTADVDLMVLDNQQLDDFAHGRAMSATYEVDPSHSQRVEWKVPPTADQPQAYHLVFNNSAGGAKVKFVEADFVVSFE